MIDTQTALKVTIALQNIAGDAEMVTTEAVEGTGKGLSSRSKPQSRPPLPIGPLDDLSHCWGVLGTWARDWHEFADMRGHLPEPTWRCVCEFLTKWWPTMATEHPAADEFADEILAVERRLASHLNRERSWMPLPGQPLCPIIHPGTNQSCAGLLLEHLDKRVIRCRDCGEEWSWSNYGRLAELLGVDPQPVPITQAAAYAQIPVRTLRDWIARGWVTPIEGKPIRVMYADVAAMSQRLREGI
jgi:hypothetical protein